MKICIISPHLDDAILSCGIFIQRRKAAGDVLLALNIFTAGTLSETRKQEDRAAMAVLGVEPAYLDELDAPDRDPRYKPLRELFFGELDPNSPYIEKVARRIQDFIDKNGVDLAVFPLAAGTHIDHRHAFEAGKCMRNVRVRYYEDRPYIIWPGILQSRMSEIGADVNLPAIAPEEMRAAADSYFYLKHFFPPGAYRDEAMPLYLEALARPSSREVSARSETLRATGDELQKLYDSLSRYGSQMKDIYADYDTFIRDSHAYERRMTGEEAYLERSWTLDFPKA
jgi:LmbE family N-acetylglucosaminyl deacetylase